MIRVERGHAAKLSVTALDLDTPADADPAPTLTIVDWAGDPVATPSVAQSTEDDTPVVGTYEATFPAQSDVGLFTATWSMTVGGRVQPIRQEIAVVGARAFTLWQLRSLPDLDTPLRYTAAHLEEARTWVEDLIERVCRTSFSERLWVDRHARRTEQLDGGLWGVELDNGWATRLVAATVDTDPVDGAALAPSARYVTAPSWPTGASTTIAYVTAYTTSWPTDLQDAALTAARYHLIGKHSRSGVTERQRTITNEAGTIGLSFAGGRDHPTGLDEVDAVIAHYALLAEPPLIA